ncbi:GNAT family protein [Aquicoccus sp. SU-CL01552]|uniref:GNAT family N-acetyltransferase n=1 Tax=Aquicoccus sp. SU-CL01552 TaxID=3127656 RepID=UPI003106EBDB
MTDPNPTRPLGPPVAGWTPPPMPSGVVLEGRYARLEPLSAEAHAALLFRAYAGHEALWDYMAFGPFRAAAQYHRWVRDTVEDPDTLFYAIRDLASDTCGGVASFLRIKPQMGVIEVGNIALAPALQRTRAATEAMVLMMGWAFDAGYRRYEWKCDALNRPSRAAAQRLGFSYEGVFRQHMVIKGRNRDTAWFAVTDRDWPALREAFSAWLDPANFDADGRQRERLGDLTRLVRVSSDPTL